MLASLYQITRHFSDCELQRREDIRRPQGLPSASSNAEPPPESGHGMGTRAHRTR